jgi:hypothetical protein
MDWIVRTFDDTSPLRLEAPAAAWLRTLQMFKEEQAMLRAVSQVIPDRITYNDPIIDKRSGETHCRWLVDWLFGGKNDKKIAKDARIEDHTEVGKRRREFARAIGLNLRRQQGRRRST